MRAAAVLPLLLLLPLAGCGDGGTAPRGSSGTTATAPRTVAGCERVDGVEPGSEPKLRRPSLRLDPARTYTATVETTCGTFRIRLAVRRSPKTTASFVSLARRRFYDGLTFSRVSPGFVIQGGDPRGDGLGGPGYQVVEPPSPSLHYTRGTVAMARGQADPPGASGSQFFVALGEDLTVTQALTPDYALLGKVVGDDEAVRRIGSVPSDPQTEAPRVPIVIRRITVAER